MAKKFSPPPDRAPRTPKMAVPEGACDYHFQVFGPQDRFPLHPDIDAFAEDATYEQFVALQDTIGFSRGILVKSGFHKWSYEHLIHYLKRGPERLRGVAIVDPDITDGELSILTDCGVLGARFYRGISEPDVGLIARVHEFGWQPHSLMRHAEQATQWRDTVLGTTGNFVVEPAAWQNPAEGLDGKGIRIILEMLETGRYWIKLSPRFSNEKTLPFSDTLSIIHELIRRAPDRMLWGSDWPHPNYFNPMPNDGDLVDLILDWAPDEAIRRRILIDNPAELFGFPPFRFPWP